MKRRNKKPATPTGSKDTKENKSGNFFRQLKSAIAQKCSSAGIKLTSMEERPVGFIVYGHTIGRTSLCPHCGKPSRSVHDHRLRKLQSTEFLGRNVRLVLRVRHFRCRNPECTCHTFSEPLKIAGPYSRMTDEVNERIRYESLNQSVRLACESLSRQHVHVGKSTCIRRAKALGRRRIGTPHRFTICHHQAISGLRKQGHCILSRIKWHLTMVKVAFYDEKMPLSLSGIAIIFGYLQPETKN